MSYKNGLSRAGILGVSLGFALLSAPAFAQSVDRSDQYYASIGNPHPELPGFPKISRSDNKIYANVFDPHPEITMPHAGLFATTGSGAPYQQRTETQAAVPQSANQAR
jgi:hypothetical protein